MQLLDFFEQLKLSIIICQNPLHHNHLATFSWFASWFASWFVQHSTRSSLSPLVIPTQYRHPYALRHAELVSASEPKQTLKPAVKREQSSLIELPSVSRLEEFKRVQGNIRRRFSMAEQIVQYNED